jgi:hypothetical protein
MCGCRHPLFPNTAIYRGQPAALFFHVNWTDRFSPPEVLELMQPNSNLSFEFKKRVFSTSRTFCVCETPSWFTVQIPRSLARLHRRYSISNLGSGCRLDLRTARRTATGKCWSSKRWDLWPVNGKEVSRLDMQHSKMSCSTCQRPIIFIVVVFWELWNELLRIKTYQTKLYARVCRNIITIAPTPKFAELLSMFNAVKTIHNPKVTTIQLFDVRNNGLRPI